MYYVSDFKHVTLWDWQAQRQAPAVIPFWTRHESHKGELVILTSRNCSTKYRAVVTYCKLLLFISWFAQTNDISWIALILFYWLQLLLHHLTVLVKCIRTYTSFFTAVEYNILIHLYLQECNVNLSNGTNCYYVLKAKSVKNKSCQCKCQRKQGKEKQRTLWTSLHRPTKVQKKRKFLWIAGKGI